MMRLAELIAKVRELASASPDFVYQEPLSLIVDYETGLPAEPKKWYGNSEYLHEGPEGWYEELGNGECHYSPSYIWDGEKVVEQPGCIIGQALKALVPEWDSHRWDAGGGSSIARVLEEDDSLEVTEPTRTSGEVVHRTYSPKVEWLTEVQMHQDQGDRWALAVEKADNNVPEVSP